MHFTKALIIAFLRLEDLPPSKLVVDVIAAPWL
jgi:hypothetical protein